MENNTRKENIARFEAEMSKVQRPGVDKLMEYIRNSDFYDAPASTRNVKNEQTGKWEKASYYMVNDKMPLGHGPKSAMIVKEYISLSSEEMYAIWWHMGFSDTGGMLGDAAVLNQAIGKYPIIWAVHTADMMASHFMEEEKENAAKFICQDTGSDASQWADAQTVQDGSEFMEALPYAAN